MGMTASPDFILLTLNALERASKRVNYPASWEGVETA
jgi:hypothetical protein